MKKSKILIVCYGGGHAAMFVPLIKRLEKIKEYSLTVLALTTAYDQLKKSGIASVRYCDFTDLSVTDDWSSYGTQIVGNADCYSGSIHYEESQAYHGINYADLVRQFGSTEAKNLFEISERQIFYPINFMLNLLKDLKPDLVIATNAPRSERAVIDASFALNIKSICLIDLFALQEFKWISHPNFASKVFVLNQSVKDFLVSKGRKSNDIAVTGNPAFDSIFHAEILENSAKLRKQKYMNEKVNILFASQVEPVIHPFSSEIGDYHLPEKNERMLRDFVEKNDGYRLILRYHPSQTVFFEKSENVLLSPRDESLHSMLHCMDIVVVMTSTVGLEAYLAGKNVISIDTSIFTDDVRYASLGVSKGVTNKRELFSAIRRLRRELNKDAEPKSTPESATLKVCDGIDQLLLHA
tara:strand:- start:541 stop:1770 length:1230 start_codon:yes stop_codon:yes gene_type:complete